MNIISKKEAIEQDLKFFFTGKLCANNHVSKRYISGSCHQCKALFREENKIKNAEYSKNHRSHNSEEIALKKKAKYQEDKAVILSKKKAYYQTNKSRIKSKTKTHYCLNRDRLLVGMKVYRESNKAKLSATATLWRKANPSHLFMRSSLRRILSNWKGGRAKYELLLGYTCKDLESHLERQFVKGMTWENRSEWHIDHIIPITHYLKTGVTDPAIINCLSNLQPIWARDNLKKNAKVLNLL